MDGENTFTTLARVSFNERLECTRLISWLIQAHLDWELLISIVISESSHLLWMCYFTLLAHPCDWACCSCFSSFCTPFLLPAFKAFKEAWLSPYLLPPGNPSAQIATLAYALSIAVWRSLRNMHRKVAQTLHTFPWMLDTTCKLAYLLQPIEEHYHLLT